MNVEVLLALLAVIGLGVWLYLMGRRHQREIEADDAERAERRVAEVVAEVETASRDMSTDERIADLERMRDSRARERSDRVERVRAEPLRRAEDP
jgi:uncharacterized protein HemX